MTGVARVAAMAGSGVRIAALPAGSGDAGAGGLIRGRVVLRLPPPGRAVAVPPAGAQLRWMSAKALSTRSATPR